MNLHSRSFYHASVHMILCLNCINIYSQQQHITQLLVYTTLLCQITFHCKNSVIRAETEWRHASLVLPSPNICQLERDQCLWTSYISWYIAREGYPWFFPFPLWFPFWIVFTRGHSYPMKAIKALPSFVAELTSKLNHGHALAAILCTNVQPYLDCLQHFKRLGTRLQQLNPYKLDKRCLLIQVESSLLV